MTKELLEDAYMWGRKSWGWGCPSNPSHNPDFLDWLELHFPLANRMEAIEEYCIGWDDANFTELHFPLANRMEAVEEYCIRRDDANFTAAPVREEYIKEMKDKGFLT